MKVRPPAKGILTFVPGVRGAPPPGSGRAVTALYGYGVWLKHLTLLWANGMCSMPDTLAELGPGSSLCVGLAAMLCGVDTYYAMDVVRFSDTARNLLLLDELVELLRNRTPRPDKGWLDFDAYLDDNLFPSHVLTDDLLDATLSETRVAAIRAALQHQGVSSGGCTVTYAVPWSAREVIRPGTVDVVLSHSVLEHVTDLEATYRALHTWLKPGAVMSHQIDFSCHKFFGEWNGHWACSELQWKLMVGKRPFLINRQPYSEHLRLIDQCGFKVVVARQHHRSTGVRRCDLSTRWNCISDDDLACSGAYVQATRGERVA